MTNLALDASALSGWEPRRRCTLEEARRRSRFMRVFRVVCATVAVAAIVAVIISIMMHSAGASTPAGQRAVAQAEALRMLNPRFTGRDGAGMVYAITAASATRLGPESPLIELEIPSYLGADNQKLDAMKGRYNIETGEVELFEEVEIAAKDGGRFATSYARILPKENRVVGDKPIVGSGPLGEVRGEAYELDTTTGRVKIIGRVRGRIAASP